MTECMKKEYKSCFCITLNSIDKLHDKLERLRFNRKLRLRELEGIPKQRKEIKREAKRLYIQSKIYELKGFNHRSMNYRRQSWALTKSLEKETRYRKMKDVHRYNRSIREVKVKIQDLEAKQTTRGETIKEYLFQDFLKCCN